jgi:hypothetical protein
MIPIYRSTDLVHWDFVADAFSDRPAGLAAPTSGLWAPEPEYLNGRYYLYFTVTDVVDAHSPEKGCGKDSAIGVATSGVAGRPLARQHHAGGHAAPRRPGCNFHWTFDPKVIEDGGRKYLYYGSYGGGIFVQRLSGDGLHAEGKATLVGAPGRYEGAEVKQHDGWWYLFASATDCCNGPLTGYAVYTGRARSPEGPFLDRLGNDMAKGRAGGTPVLSQNGNRWIGVGHNTVFTDAAGQWWTIYHGVDMAEPFFSAKDKLTRRLALLDRIDWMAGWPVAGGGRAPSDEAMAAPIVIDGGRGAPPAQSLRIQWPSNRPSACARCGATTSAAPLDPRWPGCARARKPTGRSAAVAWCWPPRTPTFTSTATRQRAAGRAARRRLPRRGRTEAGRAGRLLRHRGAGRPGGDARRRQLRQAGRDGARGPAPGRVREGGGAGRAVLPALREYRGGNAGKPPPGCASMSTGSGGRNVIGGIRARTDAPGSAAAPGCTPSARTPGWDSSRWAARAGAPPSCGLPSARCRHKNTGHETLCNGVRKRLLSWMAGH